MSQLFDNVDACEVHLSGAAVAVYTGSRWEIENSSDISPGSQ